MIQWTRYEELSARAMRLWVDYHEEYSSILDEYEGLLAKKIELDIRPLRKLNKATLADFPEVEFLGIIDRNEAEVYLLSRTEGELASVVAEIVAYVDNYVRNSLRGRIRDFRYEVEHYGEDFPLAMNPSARRSSGFKYHSVKHRGRRNGE